MNIYFLATFHYKPAELVIVISITIKRQFLLLIVEFLLVLVSSTYRHAFNGVQYGNEELATTVLESYRRKGRTDT